MWLSFLLCRYTHSSSFPSLIQILHLSESQAAALDRERQAVAATRELERQLQQLHEAMHATWSLQTMREQELLSELQVGEAGVGV